MNTREHMNTVLVTITVLATNSSQSVLRGRSVGGEEGDTARNLR